MKRVSFIGSGNVATHLAKGLLAAGMEVVQVFSRDEKNANILAEAVNAQAITDLKELNSEETDLIIISVNDDAIQEVSDLIDSGSTIVVHTSGSIGLSALREHSNMGVFYPLQTFSKNRSMLLSNVPFCLEANSVLTQDSLVYVAGLISSNVSVLDAQARKRIHLAAVFACNFTNHMMAISDLLLKESHQELNLLAPLINETVQKALRHPPVDVQTGPAVRQDQQVLNDQLKQLEGHPEFQKIYKEVSQSIINLKKHA